MTERTRAFRRHHKDRMKSKAKKIYHDLPENHAVKYADHLKVCSCWACGNQRKHFGPTIQELRNS